MVTFALWRWFGPWVLPVGMVLLNVVSFFGYLMAENRIKVNVATYAVRYALTIPAAKNGDLDPFLVVLSS